MASEAAPPAEHVTIDGETYTTIKEGLAYILVPEGSRGGSDAQQVFYNPIQQFNRDLSVLAIKAYGEEAIAKRREGLAEKRSNKKRKRKAGDEPEGRPEKIGKAESGNQEATAETTEATGHAPGNDVETKETLNRPISANQAETTDDRDTTSFKLDHLENAHQQENRTARPKRPGKFRILDALSASGLRALRYAHELPFVTSIIANDLSASAVESIKRNVAHNNLDEYISVVHDDAKAHMYTCVAEDLRKSDRFGNPSKIHKYDVIDLDPYGTAAPFFDAALQAIRDDGGLLCVTCTDAGVWAGHCYAEKSFDLYGGIPIKGMHSHEAGLRIVLHGIATAAARYSLTIEPLLSLSVDFYCRLFIKVTKSQAAAKFLGGKSMITYTCELGCGAWTTQFLMKNQPTKSKKGDTFFYKHTATLGPPVDQTCEHCEMRTRIGGPMYGGPIHSQEFIQRVLDQVASADKETYHTIPRIEGMLRTALEEHIPPVEEPETAKLVNPEEKYWAARDAYPFFFMPSQVAGILKCQTPEEDLLRGALKHLGYRVTRSHCRPGSLKTDAPWSVIWRVMKEWIRQRAPVKTENISSHTAAFRLLGLNDQPSTEHNGNEGGGDANLTTMSLQKASKQKSEEVDKEELWKTLEFDEGLKNLGRERDAKRLVRYQLNPRENWGPMTKAKGN